MSEDRLSEATGRGSESIGLAEALPAPANEDGSPADPLESLPPERPLPPVLSAPSREGWLTARRNRARLWWRRASPNLRGTVFMITALLVYAVMVGAFKHLGTAIPLVETLMIRQIIMSAVVCIIAGRSLPLAFKTDRPGLQIFRGLTTLASMLCGFSALLYIPLAQAKIEHELARTMSSVAKTRLPGSSPLVASVNIFTAALPSARMGCATVVSCGVKVRPTAWPSNPTTLRSSGMRRPRTRAVS